jgi:excisionase family DNA binding protein
MSIEPFHPGHLPRLLEVHEVAYLLKCSQETVLRRIREGKLTAVRFGVRAWRVTQADVDAFIEAHKTNGNGNGHHG